MKIPAVKGTRDFYPEDMAVRNWIFSRWREAALRAGFQEYDGPILESLSLYTQKSGDEIVGQLYRLQDFGGRELAIRPEMTPTLARMIAQRQQSLPQPIKWFSINRLCRYERPQKGRLREFFQWNLDVIGVPEPTADAEVISVALDSLEALGLTAADIEVRLSSRRLLAACLQGIGVPEDKLQAVYAAADKRGKVPDDVLDELFAKLGLAPETLARLRELMRCPDLAAVEQRVRDWRIAGSDEALDQVRQVLRLLEAFGKADYCRFDIGVVRGLAYYTGPVFEFFDRQAQLRAICGGGRYDHLLSALGGQAMPAVGLGVGDVVLTELLTERGLRPPTTEPLDYFVAATGDDMLEAVIRVVQGLRRQGWRAEFSHKPQGLGKLLRRLGETGVPKVVIVGPEEWAAGQVQVRDMTTGRQERVAVASLGCAATP